MFVNKLTAREMYSLHIRENLAQPNQMPLSKKPKRFSELFAAFLEKLGWKTCLLVTSAISGMFVSILFIKEKIFLKLNLWNLHQISRFFFLKDEPHSSGIPEINESEKRGYLNA